jgi:hypothetical protein
MARHSGLVLGDRSSRGSFTRRSPSFCIKQG